MKFFASIRRKLFNRRVNREIFDNIFPHLNGHADNGYPFHSDHEMVRLHIRMNLQAGLNLRRIAEVAGRMPEAYGNAFRYIAYRDLNEFIERYLEIAEERIYDPTPEDHRLAAKPIEGAV
jgi:hypothetical protein